MVFPLVGTESALHVLFHFASVALATVLLMASWKSCLRDRRLKIFLLAVAFLLFDIHQSMEFLEAIGIFNPRVLIPVLGVELIHSVSFGTIALLTAGVLKR